VGAETVLQTALTHEAEAEIACFDTEDVRSNLLKFVSGKHSWVSAARRQER